MFRKSELKNGDNTMKTKVLFSVLALTLTIALSLACSNAQDLSSETLSSGTSGQSDQSLGSGKGVEVPLSGEPAALSDTARSYGSSGSTGTGLQPGIWVTGQGSVTLDPDLALINIGVETIDVNVSGARDSAAKAMEAILKVVKTRGLTDADVQTLAFNIYPQYEWKQDNRRILTGYMVSNTAQIKIRDLDSVGVIIDEVAGAGGNATRINGISFTVEDPDPFMNDLRKAAVNDAILKAAHFASLTGTSAGPLVYIAEVGSGGSVIQDFGGERAFRAAAAPATSISGGELELKMSVQAAFAIQ